MATNTCNGNLVCSDGTNIPLKAEIAEGTESDLTTDTAYCVSAQNIGDYAPESFFEYPPIPSLKCGDLLQADCSTLNCGEFLYAPTIPLNHAKRSMALFQMQTNMGVQCRTNGAQARQDLPRMRQTQSGNDLSQGGS